MIGRSERLLEARGAVLADRQTAKCGCWSDVYFARVTIRSC
jgi:hypothetical protein